MKGIRLSIILPVVLFLMSAMVRAEERHTGRQELLKKEKRLEDVKKQIREEKKTVKSFSEKETSILGEIESINRNIVAKREELKKAEDRLQSVQRDVSYTNSNIIRLEKERRGLSERLRRRLRAMYRMKKGGTLSVLFSGEPEDLGRRHKYLTMIMDSDASLLTGYEANLKKLGSEKARLDALRKNLVMARADALLRKNDAEAAQREKASLLDEVKGEMERRLLIIKELEQAASELTELLDRLKTEEGTQQDLAGGFSAMKGRLPMPVEGPVISFYGKVRHPKFQTVTFNNGIVIEAPVGEAVKSVYDGRVAYVGWLKGYGQVMIMDHGGGFYTLFAHLSKTLKEKGEAVRKGEDVGLVGDTGPSASSGLYFEIRQKGVPKDPLQWFAAR